MQHAQFTISWQRGLCLRPATQLVRLARASRSYIQLRVGDKIADARNIFALLLLCASVGSVVDLNISGEDEEIVMASVSQIFASDDTDANQPADVRDH